MEAVRIALASEFSQTTTEHDVCVKYPPPCLHAVCTDLALRELVASWHVLTPAVRAKVIGVAQVQANTASRMSVFSLSYQRRPQIPVGHSVWCPRNATQLLRVVSPEPSVSYAWRPRNPTCKHNEGQNV